MMVAFHANAKDMRESFIAVELTISTFLSQDPHHVSSPCGNRIFKQRKREETNILADLIELAYVSSGAHFHINAFSVQ